MDAKIEYLKLGASTAQGGVKRLDKLRMGGVKVADEDYEKARLLAAQAEAELKATQAVRKKTETNYDEGEKAAKAKVEAAQAELSEALARADRIIEGQTQTRRTARAPARQSAHRSAGRS